MGSIVLLEVILAILFSFQLSVNGKFRSSKEDAWYTNFPIWKNYTEVNRTHESIEIAWEPV